MAGKTEDLNWMYEGTKAIVHREDYLTGRKVDKNFELYSDTVKKETEGGIEALPSRSLISSSQSGGSKKSALDIGIVRNEDPLVAIKVKEDRVRREILDNPVRMRKLQKLVRSAFEKKMRKALKQQMKKESKKEKRKKKRRSSSSSSESSSASSDDKQTKRHRPQSPARKQRDATPPRPRRYTPDRGDRHRRDLRGGREERRLSDRRRSNSPKRRRPSSSPVPERRRRHDSSTSPRDRKQSSSKDTRESRRSPEHKRSRSPRHQPSSSTRTAERRQRHDSSSASPADRKHSSPSPTRSASPSTSTHDKKRSPSLSDSDDERKRSRFSGYGLVNVKKKDTVKEERRSKSPSPSFRFPSLKPKTVALPPRTKEKLSAEEMEKRRLEMLANADWREKQRDKNLQVYEQIDRHEADRDEKKANEAADFIRPMLQHATESKSLEDRLRSNRKNVQRSHGHMESHFARKT